MKRNNLIYGITLTIVGILLIIFKSQILSILISVVGVLFAGIGLIEIIGKLYQSGIVKTVIGIVLIIFGTFLFEVCLVILGALLILYAIKSLTEIYHAWPSFTKQEKIKKLIAIVFLLAIGILFIVSRWQVVDIIFIILGILICSFGIYIILAKDALENDNVEKKHDDIYID